MNKLKNDVPYGTLDLMILKTLEPGPLHGFGLARRIEQVSEDLVKLIKALSTRRCFGFNNTGGSLPSGASLRRTGARNSTHSRVRGEDN